MRHLSLAIAALTTLAACQPDAPPKAPKTESRNDAVFVNGDFEDGTLTGWTVSTFQNKGITYPPASRTDLKLLAGGTNKTRVLTGATESVIPAGLTSAASLRVPKYGQNAVVVNELGSGYNANSLVQQFVVGASDVDPTDNKVHVRFALAAVLNSGGHAAADQPYFWVTLTNVTKGATLFGTFNFADQAGVPWQVQGSNYFTDWQSFDIAPGNVALALGDTVRLEVIGAGCSQSGHWGEVYVDGFGAFLPGLQLAASAAQAANAGSNLTYTVNYQNRGTGAAANTTVTFNLPANVSYQSVSAPGASCTAPAVGASTGQVICNVGTVNPNAAGSFTITVQIASGATGKISAGNYSIRADGVSPLIGPLVETNITTAVSYADLGVTLTDGVAALGWGQPYSFSFTVTNAGPVSATNAPVSWTMPAQLASASWTCTGTGTCGSGSGNGSIASTVTLPANTSVTYTVSGTLITGSSSSAMTNLVTVSAPATITDNNTSNNQAIDTNAIGALRTITFAKSGTGTGRVVTSPAAVDCIAGCSSASTSFIDGTVVSVTATATTGHSFGGWSGLCTGTANPCSFTVSGDGTLTGAFVAPASTITASAGAGGSISPSGAVAVASGANQTFTLTPMLGYHVADVFVDGASVGAVSSYTFTNVAAPHSIAVTFAIDTFVLASSAGANGNISSSQTVAYGGSATFTITPAANHRVASVLVDGVSVGAVNSYTFSNVTAAHTIAATFAINTFAIASSAGANGNISSSQTVAYGGSATFTITPATNYHVASVLVDGVSVGAVSSYTFSNVTAAHTIAATFAIDTFLVSSSAGVNGSITPSQTVEFGGAAAFTITPAANHHVEDVFVDGQSVGAVGSYTFTNVTEKHTIAVTFTLDAFVVSSSAGANGNITTSQTVSYGGSATFAVTAAAHHHVADVLVDGVSVGALPSYTFTNVTAAHSIAATFAIDTNTVTSSAGPNGSISASQTPPYGGMAIFTITPAAHHHILDVLVDGESVGAVSSHWFVNVTESHTISATFAIDAYLVSSSAGANGTISASQTVDHGDSATFTIAADAHHHIADVLVDGESVGALGTYTFENVTAAHGIAVSFAVDTFVITATGDQHGTVACTSPVAYGDAALCTITPAQGYELVSLFDDGIEVSVEGATYSATNVTGARSITATFKRSSGSSCSSSADCGSGRCVDGVCCNSACNGQCEACDVAGHVGECTPVAGAPHGARTACDSDGSACGGSCDGTARTACVYPGASTSCREASCASGVATLAAACDGQGSCPAEQTQACAPYVCGATACAGDCVRDSDCAAGNWCSGGVCEPKKLAGITCGADNQCGSGFCTDGVCCNVACNGQCEACDVAGSVGSCAPVSGAPHAGRPECASDQTACGGQCDGEQRDACAYPTASTQCRAPSCGAGVATLAAACDGQGACPVEQTQACGAFICGANACLGDCQADSDCAAGNWCSAGVCVAKSEQGGSCATDNQCGSGFCTDGVCCNSSCDGQCQACDVAGHAGTCTPVIGAPHGERQACDTDGSSCGGVCNGEDVDACEYPTVSCRAASCEQGVATLGASCSAGHCPAVQEQSCGQFACGVDACNGDCANDSDCAAGNWCSAGVCVPRVTQGGSCTADSQCGGGNCVDGVCCNTTCDGQCEACDVAGSVGTCVPVAGAPHGDRVACATDGSMCGGTCDGTKRDSCSFPEANVACVAASCTNGVETHASTCTGSGSCAAPQTTLCGMNTCGATACSSAMCETDADCGADSTCAAGVCQPKHGEMQWKVEGGGFGCQATGGDVSGLGLALLALTYLSRRRAVRGAEQKSSSEGRSAIRDVIDGPFTGAQGLDVGSAASPRFLTASRAVVRAATPVDSALNVQGDVTSSTTTTVGRDAAPSAATSGDSVVSFARVAAASPEAAVSPIAIRRELRETPAAATPVRASLIERMMLNRDVSPEAPTLRGATAVRELLASDADASLLSAINSRRRSCMALAAALVGLAAMTASPAQAQAQSSAVSRTFLLERFTPQAGDADVLGVQSPTISAHLLPRVTLWGSYADVPLRAVRLTDDDMQQVLAANQTTLTLAGSFGLFGRVELGLAVPVVITRSVGAPAIDAGLTSGGGQVSLGDVRIQAKVRLVDVGAFSFGASLPVTLPTAGTAPYAGSSGVTATPTLLAQWSGPRRSAVLVDLGVVLRQPQQLLNLTVGNAMAWSVAGKIDLLPQRDLSAMLSVGGEIGFLGAGAAQNPLEALVALRWMPIKGLALTLGAGPGLSSGYGTPRFRVVASIGWVPPERQLPAHPPASRAADQALSEPLPPVVAVAASPVVEEAPVAASPVVEEARVAEPQPAVVAIEAPAPRVIPTLDKVYFETGRAEVQRSSLRVLDDVARVMSENPSTAKVRIEAHTDNAAPAEFNDRLSSARAAWVREYLIAHGVDASRLESEGFGLRRPIADNTSLEGRTANRRVEFVIIEGE